MMAIGTVDNWVSSSQSSPVFGGSATLDHWVVASAASPLIYDAGGAAAVLTVMVQQSMLLAS